MQPSNSERKVPERPIIPAKSRGVTQLCVPWFLAILVGLILRLLFAIWFPTTSDDSQTYLQLARNWADHHVYGLWLNGHLIPTDLRTPGYPAFLAWLAMIFGRTTRAIVLSQVIIDLGTCLLTAALSAVLASQASRPRVAIVGLWLAATCPFMANYTATVLTETLTTFLTTAALVLFTMGLGAGTGESSHADLHSISVEPASSRAFSNQADAPLKAVTGTKPWLAQRHFTPLALALLGAFITGFATLLRPEMPLLLVVAVVVYGLRWWKSWGIRRLFLTGAAMACAFLLPLMPWAIRNLFTLHEFQIIAPRYATMPGEYEPVGFDAWTKTWLERYRDVYSSVWNVGEEPLEINDFPAEAFDSPEEKAQISKLFQQYNDSPDLDLSPEVDRKFAEIARERTRRHPLRTYLQVPFERALTIWFTPRTELLPIDGKLWPIRQQWEDSHAAFLTTAGFGALGYMYVALALGGTWFVWRAGRIASASAPWDLKEGPNLWGVALLLSYLFARTAFLTTVEAPEPRYVVSCYPVVLALAAQIRAAVASRE